MTTSYAFSASKKNLNTTNQTKFDIRVPVKNWLKKMNDGFTVGLAKGSLDFNSRLRQTGIDESRNETSSTKIQLTAGWESIRTNVVGYSAFATYQDLSLKNEDLRNMRLSANATWGLTNQAYTYGGLNFGKYYGSGEVEANIESGIGYQAGIGFKMHEKVNLEVEYLTLLNEGKLDGFNINLAAKGIMLKLNTPFTFNL
ncbi:MAG: hypothetical protein ACJAS4_003159 [Bacteriovoracaceae bacterium]|jgi:hypothetical protein